MLQSRGINIRYSMPYTPQQNGAAERENRIIMEASRSILHHKGLPLKLWAEAVNTAVYLLNRTGPTGEKGKHLLNYAQNGKSCSVANEPSVDHDHGSEIELIRSSDVPDSDMCQEIGEASCDSRESPDEQERNLRDRSMLKKPARYDNCVLLAEHEEPDT
ncbi:hypothetical protein AVEN_96182-1 [Araneus ventricosus]|uniref:Integrase catalytic domain-containing protein n=1 Tax=Araneus ventricosus TaxID=182803 RepID=A0A4Y2FR75_ARAVE|nr:hypothetical protein AVEN_96182-1 [Araneus ventricosus]